MFNNHVFCWSVIAFLCAQFACANAQVDSGPGGSVSVRLGATSTLSLSHRARAVLEAQPSGESVKLTKDHNDVFNGRLLLPVGDQTLTITLYDTKPGYRQDEQEVGTGSAKVNVVADQTTQVAINVFDTTDPSFSAPALGPVVTAFAAGSEFVPAGNALKLRVAVFEPEGETLRYTFNDDCGGSFSPESGDTTSTGISTTWTAPSAIGICTLSVSAVDGDDVTSTSSLEVAVQNESAATGLVEVEGTVVDRPIIYRVTIESCAIEREHRNSEDKGNATCPTPLEKTSPLDVYVAHSSDSVSLTDDCGGSFTPQPYGRQFDWTVPQSAEQCIVTASATREGLTTEFSVAVIFKAD